MHILSVWAYWQYHEPAIEPLTKVVKRGHKVSILLAKSNLRENGCLNFATSVCIPDSWDFGSHLFSTPYPIVSNSGLKDVSKYIKSIKPDVVHFNSHLFLSNYEVFRIADAMAIPTVITIHGVIAERSFAVNLAQELYIRTISKSLLDKASSVVCLTEDDSIKIGAIMRDPSKIHIVPNFVDTDFFTPEGNREDRLITWVGRLVPEKGLIYLIEAMAKVHENSMDVKLCLVGDGPQRSELQSLASKLRLEGQVTFLGSVDRQKVRKMLRSAALFAFPSLREGMPLALLEAMACGAPVVASDISGVRTAVTNGEDGVLVCPHDSGALAKSIIDLLKDPQLAKRLGTNARNTVIKKFGPDAVLTQMENVYCQTVRDY